MLTLADVHAARTRIRALVPPTPLRRHPLLEAETRLRLWVKHENHNPTGAFKIRGGLNLIGSLTPEERARGVVTASTGNHGQSVAMACQVHGVRARRQQSRKERRHACVRRDAGGGWP
jgi:threonine dehydratase